MFSYRSHIDNWELADPELIADRRSLTLRCLEILYTRIAKLEKVNVTYRKLLDQGIWEVEQLRKLCSAEALNQISIDRTVNKLDPDFSFEKAAQSIKAAWEEDKAA